MKLNKNYHFLLEVLLVIIVIGLSIGLYNIQIIKPDKVGDVRTIDQLQYINKDGELKTTRVPIKLEWKTNAPLILQKTLTDRDLNEEERTIMSFFSIYQEVKVYNGDQLIFSRTENNEGKIGKAVPSGWNYISLSESKKGDILRIEMKGPYEFSSGDIPTINIGAEGAVVREIYSVNMRNAILDMVTVFLGCFWIVHHYYIYRRSRDIISNYSVGAFAIIVGVWLHYGSDNVMSYYISDGLMCFLGQLSFLLLPMAYSYMMYSKSKSITRRAFYVLFIISFINLFVSLSVQFFGIVDFIENIWISHVIIGCMLFQTIYDFFKRIKEKQKIFRSLSTYGVMGVVIAATFELMRVYFYALSNSGIWIRVALIFYVITIELDEMYENKRRELRNLETEANLKEMKLRQFVGQIQPHFIYNTLGSIQGLISVDPEEAEKLVYTFSKYLRENIDATNEEERIPFKKELRHIFTYINIEKVRFEERVNFTYDIDNDNFYIPVLSLQPLIENAVKHGICKKDIGGTVSLICKQNKNIQTIIIQDDGVGFNTEEVLKKEYKSVGLKNSIFRLQNLMGAKINVESEIGKGTTITITYSLKNNRVYAHETGRSYKGIYIQGEEEALLGGNEDVKNNLDRRREDNA